MRTYDGTTPKSATVTEMTSVARGGRTPQVSCPQTGGCGSHRFEDLAVVAPGQRKDSSGSGSAPLEAAPAPVPVDSPAALPKKSVTVNVTYLKGGSTDLATHLTKTNSVYKQADVDVKSGTEVTLDEKQSKAILGDDLTLDEYTDSSKPTAEETALLKQNRKAGEITMYYVGAMSKSSLGEAFSDSDKQPPSFVYASNTTRTWPHELGHVLLDTGESNDKDNFMAQTKIATGKELMTDGQIKTIRGSSYVK